jgi:hypothetical protein
METVNFVYPDGRREPDVEVERVRVGDTLVTATGDYVVGYVHRRFSEPRPIAYLSLMPGTTTVCQLVFFNVNGAQYPLTLAEAAEIGDRLRLMGGGVIGSPTTSAAVRIEQLVEEPPDKSGHAAVFDSETDAMCSAIEGWLLDVGAFDLPERVMELRYALHDEAMGSGDGDEVGEAAPHPGGDERALPEGPRQPRAADVPLGLLQLADARQQRRGGGRRFDQSRPSPRAWLRADRLRRVAAVTA